MKFHIGIADRKIALENQSESLYPYFQDYMIEGCIPDINVTISPEDIEAERNPNDNIDFPLNYLEFIATLRKVSEVLPLHNRLLFHGAAITYDGGNAYLFAAPSGTGKTTHIRLWKKYLGDKVDIINGDKPFLAIEDGYVSIYGTPWAGKEGWQKNRNGRLEGICFLKQGKVNFIRKLEPLECLNDFFRQTYIPKDEKAAEKALELLEKLLEYVPVYQLTCDISETAVQYSFEMMTGLEYEKEKTQYED